ncbi:Similar to Smg6: Telomerase-binding protein EST1A (Mus musculus) [Cotesia congregata]|uniref:Similar to Smg6: Telomerase-binding protein EST1A (Mus musculus) n=1 Tax=Cotesia congregata TaxID=51543 RepID=A0A8J2HI06_COTCN|nr:Similar to Smg6: Telomerase-binding protein EST1A (Mus musculus) [Cotesia congregata]
MATHDKGRRKWIDNSQDNFDKNKLMGGRRGLNRGPQQIYTPGSGPLKKSDRQDEFDYDASLHKSSVQDRLKRPFNNISLNNPSEHSNNSVNMLADKFNDVHVNRRPVNDHHHGKSNNNHMDADRRKNKKPEQQLYVPKKIYESISEQDNSHRTDSRNRSRQSIPSEKSSRDKDLKRFSRKPRENDKESWRPESPVNKSFNRPRDQRRRPEDDYTYRRDTRSELDKYPRKPPTGRRIPKMNAIKIESLPPRLQRKYFEENGIEPPINHNDEPWDSGNYNNYYSHPMPSQMINMPPVPNFSHQNSGSGNLNSGSGNLNPGSGNHNPGYSNHNQWNTLPTRSRGRGRFRPEELDLPSHRPGTPDQYSAPSTRSHTPSQEMTRSYDRRGSNSTMYTSMESLSRADNILMPPPVSPATYSRNQQYRNNTNNAEIERNYQAKSPEAPADILDWSEEVELSEKLENERLSRSSSVVSISEGSGNQAKRNRSRKKRRERKRTESEELQFLEQEQRNRRNICESGEQFLEQGNRQNSREFAEQFLEQDQRNRQNSREFGEQFREPFLEQEQRNRQNSRERKNNQYNRENSNNYNNRFERRRSRESSREAYRNEENWRTGKRISMCESEDGKNAELSVELRNNVQQPGVLVLPAPNVEAPQSPPYKDRFNRKTLFDPNNPNKPIVVPSPGTRAALVPEVAPSKGRAPSQFQQSLQLDGVAPQYLAEQMNNSRPIWYDSCPDNLKNAVLLRGIEAVDRELDWLLTTGGLTANWDRVAFLRQSLQQSLQTLLETDIKFCQAENVEQHFWKILFYNIIEMLRKIMPKEAGERRDVCKKIMLKIIDDGTVYFENLLTVLENTYRFKLEVFLSSSSPPKGLGFVGLALISAQKIFLFLGDLARYKEQANETTNYGKSRQWYLKAQQINPKNGRPYNQLALLAYYAYESTERKRKEEREWKERARMKEKEGANNIAGGLRRETWVHPGGRRMRRTTSAATACENKLPLSDIEDLAQLSSVEVNKRFVTSYLHVHGKLITKIGMETFQEAGVQMLREFRALLQHSPLPLPGTRLLQLLALNMFAIETTQLKASGIENGKPQICVADALEKL